ncbi:ankyrin repeat domain-containing protein [Bacillus cereus group sp. MYBK71-2]|uniref:ankyrin repeat domain-containing protein n=1 Tax=Bacillus cereus group sp. MYBK71-2 TaxID=3450611 RepID=UPI003F7AB757
MWKLPSIEVKRNSPIWKRRSIGVLTIIVIIIIASKLGAFGGTPKGMEAEFYNNALKAFNEINYVVEENKPVKNNEGIKWMDKQLNDMDKVPSNFSEEEKELLRGLQLLFNAASGLMLHNERIEVLDDKSLKSLEQNYWSIRSVIAERLNIEDKIKSNSLNLFNSSDTKKEENKSQDEVKEETKKEDKSLSPSGSPSNINDVDDYGVTKLARASGEGNIELVKELLKKGADPNLYENHGEPPLIWAVRSSQDNIVKVLLEAGANPNVKLAGGITPLMIAKEEGANVTIKYLLEHGAEE